MIELDTCCSWRIRVLLFYLLVCLTGWFGTPPAASGAPTHRQILWEIGKPDHSSAEFKSDWDFSESKNPAFVVGQSKPDQDWSDFHPGPLTTANGRRIHPFTVTFQLRHPPRGTYYVDINALFKGAYAAGVVTPLRAPQYLVDINGHKGRFYFHPKLSYDIGDWSSGMDIVYSTANLKIPLPATYFHEGENRLVLTCLDEADNALLPHEKTDNTAAGIYYDALSLTNDPNRQFNEAEVRATALPTIFYRAHGADPLSEVILLETSTARRDAAGSASLLVQGRRSTCQFTSEYDFGESQCAVEIPELPSAVSARLILEGAGQRRSYPLLLKPQKKFKLFLVSQIHLDPGYTDYRPNSYEVNDRSLDFLVQELESHPKYQYTPDGSWILGDYMQHRDERARQRLIKLLEMGRISLPAQLFNSNTALMSQEELNHLAYFSTALHRHYGINYEGANLCDVPAASWSLPSYLNSIGVRHLVVGSNPWRTPLLIYGKLNRHSPFWWEGPDRAKVLTWYARQYSQMQALFGAPASMTTGVSHLPIFLQDYASDAYQADAVMIYGSQGDNEPFDKTLMEMADTWNQEFAYPEIRVATMKDFFGYMEQRYGSSFPTLRGDGGASWDEMAAADAHYTAVARRAKDRVVTAETLASLGVITNQDFVFPLSQDNNIWSNLLMYSEHIWGHFREWEHVDSDLTQGLLRDKEAFSVNAAHDMDDLLRRGFDQLQSKINAKGDLVVAFNGLSWPRSGLVEMDIPRGSGLTDLKTKQPVTLELLRRPEGEDYERVRFWAADIPSLGYRSYSVSSPSTAHAPQMEPSPSEGVIENDFYRITVDLSRGGISSIYDKELGHELVDRESPYALDQYVYADYGHEGASLVTQRKTFNSTLLKYSISIPAPDLRVAKAGQVKILGLEIFPWGKSLFLESSALHTPRVATEIRLFDRVKRIELINTVNKDVVRAPESVYFAFPFASRKPTVRYDIQNGWVDPTRDQLPGANKEWFAAQHWVAVSDAQTTVELALNEAPLFTIGDIVRGRWPQTLDVRSGTVFSYVMNNYDGDDERPYQGGEFTFHYVIGSERQFDPTALTRLALEATRPIEIDASALDITRAGTPPEPLDAAESSFLRIDNAAVVLSAWKGAEDGNGNILRFYNTTDRPVTAHIEFPGLQFDGLNHTNPVEADKEALQSESNGVTLALGPHENYSLRVKGFRLRQR